MLFSPWTSIGWRAWPLLIGFSLFFFFFTLLLSFSSSLSLLLLPLLLLSLLSLLWLRDIAVEGATGWHNSLVVSTLYLTLGLFITSEVALFFSLFWAAGYFLFLPSIFVGAILPSALISPLSLPFFNLATLLWSSALINLSHGYLRLGKKAKATLYLLLTLLLGLFFLVAQATEYYSSLLTITDGAFFSSFFFITGVHGSHVIGGLLLVLFNLIRLLYLQCNPGCNLSFLRALLYWHFVDVIWVLLWCFLYLFPSLF